MIRFLFSISAISCVFIFSNTALADINSDDVRGKLKSVGNIALQLKAPAFVPHTQENSYVSYGCVGGNVTGLFKGQVISCDIKEELIIPPGGTAIAPINATNITWQDSAGYSYILVTSGIATVSPEGIAKFFAGEALTDPEYYAVTGGRFQTSNPDLVHLNNKFILVEDQGVTAPDENGYVIVDYKLLLYDDDRNLFPNDNDDDDDSQ